MKIKEISNSKITSSLGISRSTLTRSTLIKYVYVCKSGFSFGKLDKVK
ncbi:MAG: hypothetical protein LBI73_15700 [Myroides sp.]|nr:hypothetical protein [Myroides sp.]